MILVVWLVLAAVCLPVLLWVDREDVAAAAHGSSVGTLGVLITVFVWVATFGIPLEIILKTR